MKTELSKQLFYIYRYDSVVSDVLLGTYYGAIECCLQYKWMDRYIDRIDG